MGVVDVIGGTGAVVFIETTADVGEGTLKNESTTVETRLAIFSVCCTVRAA